MKQTLDILELITVRCAFNITHEQHKEMQDT